MHDARRAFVASGNSTVPCAPCRRRLVELERVRREARVVVTDVASRGRRTRARSGVGSSPTRGADRSAPARRAAAARRARDCDQRFELRATTARARGRCSVRSRSASASSTTSGSGASPNDPSAPWSSVSPPRRSVDQRAHGGEIGLARRGARERVDHRRSRPGPRSARGARPRLAGSRPRRGRAPGRRSTAATGTAPRRSSSTPTTAASATPGTRSSAARTTSGCTLYPPRRMVSSARPTIQRKPSASRRARSVVRTQSSVPSCAARTSSRPTASSPEVGAVVGIDDRAASTRRARDRRCRAWPTANCSWSARFQPATPPPNSVAPYDVSTGTP